MPADMNDYFKKKKPTMNKSTPGNGGGAVVGEITLITLSIIWVKVHLGLLALIVFAFAMFIIKPFTIINSGEVGIKINTGKFDEKPLECRTALFHSCISKNHTREYTY